MMKVEAVVVRDRVETVMEAVEAATGHVGVTVIEADATGCPAAGAHHRRVSQLFLQLDVDCLVATARVPWLAPRLLLEPHARRLLACHLFLALPSWSCTCVP